MTDNGNIKNLFMPLPLPDFFNQINAEKYDYAPNQLSLLEEAIKWRKIHEIKPSACDKRNIHLLLIDVQKDFCFPQGSLYVGGRDGRGAINDSNRIAQFIYRNLHTITNTTATLDTHFAFQIFFSSFWTDRDNNQLTPFREITAEDIERGEALPNPAIANWLCNGDYSWLLNQTKFYCNQLEKAKKYKLYLWPPHCILGSSGHPLVGVVHEARMFHSFVRGVQSWAELKGSNELTENYSVFRPEVVDCHDNTLLDKPNTSLIKTLLATDMLIIAGQAASHCVKSTIEDLFMEIIALDKSLVSKVYILSDCMSAVTVPDGKGGFIADFTEQAEQTLNRFSEAGMHIVKSTEPMANWPGF